MPNDGTAAPGGGASAPARPSSFRSSVNRSATTSVPSGDSGGAGSNGIAPASTGTPAGNGVTRLPPGSVDRARAEVQEAREAAQADPSALIPEATPEAEPEPEMQPEPAVDDGDPWEAQLHGMTTREFVEAMKSGEIPDALADKLWRMAEINGTKRKIGLHELNGHIMRQADYSRQMAETKRHQQEAAAAKQQYDRSRGQWDAMMRQWLTGADGKIDTKAFRRDMRRMGMGGVVVEAAQALAREMQALQSDNPEIMQLRYEKKLREEAEEDRAWQDEQRRLRIQQEDRQRDMQRSTEAFQARLGELVPAAFQQHQLNSESPLTQRLFNETFHALWDPNDPKKRDVTPELLHSVCASVKEQLEDIAAAHGKSMQPANDNGRAAVPVRQQANGGPQPPQLPTPQPLGTQRLAGAPGNGAAKKQIQARPNMFRQHLKGKR